MHGLFLSCHGECGEDAESASVAVRWQVSMDGVRTSVRMSLDLLRVAEETHAIARQLNTHDGSYGPLLHGLQP